MTTLSARYMPLADCLTHDGVPLDCAIDPWALSGLDGHLELVDAPCVLDRRLARRRDKLVADLVAQGKAVFDGPVLALVDARPGVLRVRPGTYFDMLASCPPVPDPAGHVRELIEHRCGGDPLRSGAGRCAAVAVSALLVLVGPDGSQRFVLGQRSDRLAVAAGDWHVLPAGMIEPADRRPLRDGLGRELVEEVLHPSLASATAREQALDGAQVLGVSYDLQRLRPEFSVAVAVSDPGQVAVIADPSEYQQTREWPLTDEGIQQALTELAGKLVPSAAGTLTLARLHLRELTARLARAALTA